MSKLTFTYDDFTPSGIEKYRVDLQRRLRATGVIGPDECVDVERGGFSMEVDSHVTHLDNFGYTVIDDQYAVQDVKDVKATQAKKRWWQR